MDGTHAATGPDLGPPPEAGDRDGDRRIGRYVLGARLGVGATATAWRARDTASGVDVCVKVLHPNLLRDPVARARLETEAAAAAELSHPALLPVLDVHITESEAALVFPLIEGESLAARLARSSRLQPREAAAVGVDVSGALAAVHARGRVHRDVKPGNVLLAEDGVARLLDFGISHSVALPADELTGAGMTVGTLPYMSPEQLAGLRPEPANDVYALGAVLYEMLAGSRPYEAATPDELAQAHLQPPADVPAAPRPLLALAWAALARDAGARPSARQLHDGLRAWLDEGTLPAPPMALPTGATVAVAAAGAASASPAAASTRDRPPTAELPSPALAPRALRGQRRVRRRPPAWAAGVAVLGLAIASAFVLGPNLIRSAGSAGSAGGDGVPAASPTPSGAATLASDIRENVLSVIVGSLNRLVEALASGKGAADDAPAGGEADSGGGEGPSGPNGANASDGNRGNDGGRNRRDRNRGGDDDD